MMNRVLTAAVVVLLVSLQGALCVPKPCCFSPQFQANFRRETSYFDAVRGLEFAQMETKLYFDYSAKLVANIVTSGGLTIRTVSNYSSGIAYTITPKNCSQMPITEPLRSNCIPQNATFLSEAKVGSGARALSLRRWKAGFSNGQETVYYTVVAKDCIPVSFKVISKAAHQTSFFSNVRRGFDMPAIFDVPSGC